MPKTFVDLVYLLLHLIGFFLFVSGFLPYFLYEGEEGQIQNKLQSWWINLNDRRRTSRSQDTAFMREVARLTGQGFDRLLGKRLLSMRFIAVSTCLTFASFFLFAFVVLLFVHTLPAGASAYGAFLLFAFFAGFGLVPVVTNSKVVLVIWWGAIVVTLLKTMGFLLFVLLAYGIGPTLRAVGYVMLLLTSSLLCDLLYLAITRWLLRRVSNIDQIWEIGVNVALNFLVLIALIMGPILLGIRIGEYAPMAGGLVMFSFVLNSIDVVAGLAAFVLAFLLLLHRLLWPAIERPVYAVYRHTPLKHKNLLWTMGFALMVLPKPLNIDTLKTILEIIINFWHLAGPK